MLTLRVGRTVKFRLGRKHKTWLKGFPGTSTQPYVVLTVSDAERKTPRACTLKHYGLVKYGFRSKLMCLSKPVEKTYNSNKTPAYSEVCLFTVYESVILMLKQPVVYDIQL